MTVSPQPALIALDWGTSSLRAWLVGPNGDLLDARRSARGMIHVKDHNFAAAFDDVVGDWRAAFPNLPALACGMVGAAQGWREAAYLPCPAGPEDLAQQLTRVEERNLWIVPGVMQRSPANVMRGEETQIAGTLALRPDLSKRARLVMPGTHSKWVDIADGRIVGFSSWMTGELFAILKNHSILGIYDREGAAPISPDQAHEAFDAGIRAAQAAGHASGLLFSARARVLTGDLAPGAALDYLSGLLIAEELMAALRPNDVPLLIGDPILCERYRYALGCFGCTDTHEISDAALAGLWHVATAAQLPALEAL